MPPTRPAKPRVGPFSPAELARMAWTPSSRAPRVAEMHDPDAFPTCLVRSADLTGRAFLSGHHDGSEAARLVAVQPFMAELARCPLLRGLRRLDLSGNRIGPAGVRQLAWSPYLDGLEQLVLSGNAVGPDGMAALRAASWFPSLRVLELADNGLGAADIVGLPPGLSSLDLSNNPLGPAGADAIRRAAGHRLDTLRAAGCGLGPAGSGLLDVAGAVDLCRNRMGLTAALDGRPLGDLHALDLGFNDLGDAVVAGLAGVGPPALLSLGLAGNRLTAACAKALAFPAFEALDVSANPLGDDGAVAALGGRSPALARLDLSNCDLTDAGVERLTKAVGLRRLRSLSLAWNRIGDAGARNLAGCLALAGLDELDLTGTGLGFAGAVALAESKYLGNLRRLTLGEIHRLPADGIELLRDRSTRPTGSVVMAVNLPPQYHDAEARYKKGKTPEEKLAALREMWVILPKHKASEKVQADLKTKISELTDDIEQAKLGPKKAAPGTFKVPKQGAGQVVFLGPPNAGKSRLLTRLTKATPAVAPYPFTTREPVPGMMDYEDVRVQLVDLPPVTADHYEHFVTDITRAADAAVLFLDLADDDGPAATQATLDRLKAARRVLVRELPAEDDPTTYSLRTLLVFNKGDDEAADIRLEMARESFADRFPSVVVSAEQGTGLDEVRKAIYDRLGVMRVYTKQPGKPADMTSPFTCPVGSTLAEFAGRVHKDFEEGVKTGRVWGSGAFDGQTVGRDHVMHDKDVVELHL